MSTPERAGWYDDPEDETQLRYFDGIIWSERTEPKSTRVARVPADPAAGVEGGSEGGADDGGERGAQLVARIGDEVRAQLLGTLHPRAILQQHHHLRHRPGLGAPEPLDDGRRVLDVTFGDDKARPVRESLRHERHTVDGESGDRDERATRLRGPRIMGDGVDAVDALGHARAQDLLEFCAAHIHPASLTTRGRTPVAPRGER